VLFVVCFVLSVIESIRTMPAPLLTTVPSPPEIATREDHQSIFEIIILTLLKFLSFFHH